MYNLLEFKKKIPGQANCKGAASGAEEGGEDKRGGKPRWQAAPPGGGLKKKKGGTEHQLQSLKAYLGSGQYVSEKDRREEKEMIRPQKGGQSQKNLLVALKDCTREGNAGKENIVLR